MTADERKPQRFGEIVDAALSAFASRWLLYLGLALASILIQFVCTAAGGSDAAVLTLVLANSIVNAFPSAVASIDVVGRVAGEKLPTSILLRAASARWPAVAVVSILVNLVEGLWITPKIFGGVNETLYFLLTLPALAIAGILSLPTVIASIDQSVPILAVPAFSLLRSFFIGTAWPNLGRLCIGGGMVAVPLMAEILLQKALHARGLSDNLASFWGNVPLDAVVVAPFQAFFTYLYLDFVAKQTRN